MRSIQQGEYLDCIAMKRSIQRQIAAETKGMTPLERLAYYRKLAQESPFALARKSKRPSASRHKSKSRDRQIA